MDKFCSPVFWKDYSYFKNNSKNHPRQCKIVVSQVPLPTALLRYNLHITLFKVCSVMIWYMYVSSKLSFKSVYFYLKQILRDFDHQKSWCYWMLTVCHAAYVIYFLLLNFYNTSRRYYSYFRWTQKIKPQETVWFAWVQAPKHGVQSGLKWVILILEPEHLLLHPVFTMCISSALAAW